MLLTKANGENEKSNVDGQTKLEESDAATVGSDGAWERRHKATSCVKDTHPTIQIIIGIEAAMRCEPEAP